MAQSAMPAPKLLKIKLKGAGSRGPQKASTIPRVVHNSLDLKELRAAVDAFSRQGVFGMPGEVLLQPWREEDALQQQQQVVELAAPCAAPYLGGSTQRVRRRRAAGALVFSLAELGPQYVVWGRARRRRSATPRRLARTSAQLTGHLRRMLASDAPPAAAAGWRAVQQPGLQQLQPQQQQQQQQQHRQQVRAAPAVGDHLVLAKQQQQQQQKQQAPGRSWGQAADLQPDDPMELDGPAQVVQPEQLPLSGGATLVAQKAAAGMSEQQQSVQVKEQPLKPQQPAGQQQIPADTVNTGPQQQQQQQHEQQPPLAAGTVQQVPSVPAVNAAVVHAGALAVTPAEGEPQLLHAVETVGQATSQATSKQPQQDDRAGASTHSSALQQQESKQQLLPTPTPKHAAHAGPSAAVPAAAAKQALQQQSKASTQPAAADERKTSQRRSQAKQKHKLDAAADTMPPAKKARTGAQTKPPSAAAAAAPPSAGIGDSTAIAAAGADTLASAAPVDTAAVEAAVVPDEQTARPAAAAAPETPAVGKPAAPAAKADSDASKAPGAGKQAVAAAAVAVPVKAPEASPVTRDHAAEGATAAAQVAATPAIAQGTQPQPEPAPGAELAAAAAPAATTAATPAAGVAPPPVQPSSRAAAAPAKATSSPEAAPADAKPESPPSETSHQQPIVAAVPQHMQQQLQQPLQPVVPQLPQEQTVVSRDRSQCSLQQPAESPAAAASGGVAAGGMHPTAAGAASVAAMRELPMQAMAGIAAGGPQPKRHLLELEASAMTPAALALGNMQPPAVSFRSVLPDKPFASQEEACQYLDRMLQEARRKKHAGDDRNKQNNGWDVFALTYYAHSALEFLRYWDATQKALKQLTEAGQRVDVLRKRLQSLLTPGLLKQVSQLCMIALQNASNCKGQDVQKQALRMLLERLSAICQLRHLHSQRDALQQHASLLKGAAAGGSKAQHTQQQQQQGQRAAAGRPPARAAHAAAAASSSASSPRGKQSLNKRSPDDSNTSNQDRVQLPGMLGAEQHSPGLAHGGSPGGGSGGAGGAAGGGAAAGAGASQERQLMLAESACAEHLQDMLKITDGMHQTVMRMQQFLESPEVLSDDCARAAALHISTLGLDAGMFSIPRVVAHAEAALVQMVRSGRRHMSS